MPKISELPIITSVLQVGATVPILQSGVTSQITPLNLLGKGWAFYDDSQYTVGSPLAINNARTKISIDGLGSNNETDFLPDGVSAFWNTTTNKFTPVAIGDCYDIRLEFVVETMKDSTFLIELDIGSPLFVISSQSLIASKTTGVPIVYSFNVPIFTLATFVTNGGEVYIDTTVDAQDLDIYNMKIFIKRDFAAI